MRRRAADHAEIQRLSELYVFKPPESVRSYLIDNPDVIPLLQSARGEIERWFLPRGVTASVIHDPEEGDRHLALHVISGLDPGQALDRLRQFDEGWWLDVDDRGKVVIDVRS